VFHRIVSGFVIQGGDPSGDGTGGPGYQAIEVPPADTKYTKGVVAMAKGGNDPAGASGSQFFIVTGDDAGLPTDYAVLGRVVAGEDVAAEIEGLAGGSSAAEEPPEAWAYIEKATVVEAE